MSFKALNWTENSIGGTSGIGRALLRTLSRPADVVPTSRRIERFEAHTPRNWRTRAEKPSRHLGCFRPFALQRVSGWKRLRRFCSRYFINSHRTHETRPTLEFSEEDWSDIIVQSDSGTLARVSDFGGHKVERGYGRLSISLALSQHSSRFTKSPIQRRKPLSPAFTKSFSGSNGSSVDVNAIAPRFRHRAESKLLTNPNVARISTLYADEALFLQSRRTSWRGGIF